MVVGRKKFREKSNQYYYEHNPNIIGMMKNYMFVALPSFLSYQKQKPQIRRINQSQLKYFQTLQIIFQISAKVMAAT